MSDAAPAGAGAHQDQREATGHDGDEGDASPDEPDPITGSFRAQPQEVTRKPAVLSGVLAMAAAAVAGGMGGFFSGAALALAAVAVGAIGLAISTGSRRAADLAGGILVAAAVVAGTQAPAAAMLGMAVAVVLAWDMANNAIDVGQQLGREADTARAELAHAGATLGVGAITAGFAFVVYQIAAGGQPVTALVFLLLAAIVLVSALRL